MNIPRQSYPSIFNDVIGPVMRGPSSSHCAASVRIGKIVRDLMGGEIDSVLIEFDPTGSLATTHESQGTDMGLFSGMLGWDAADERMADSPQAIQDAGIDIRIEIVDIKADHPNTYKMTMTNSHGSHSIVALSVGGGMIELVEIDSVTVSIAGDYYETLIYFNSDGKGLLTYLRENIEADYIQLLDGDDAQFVEIKGQSFLSAKTIKQARSLYDIQAIEQIEPVLPVMARKGLEVPFVTCNEMLDYNRDKDLELWELAIAYESARGAISADQVKQKMADLIAIMQGSIDVGLKGTDYSDRILGVQSGNFRDQMHSRNLIEGGVLNNIILFTTAIMESKSAMELIVAAPTAGACGGFPGATIGAARMMELPDEDVIRAMLAGGIIGIFIAEQATFAAEVGGCQAEGGAASGMAAAALVTLAGGSTQQAINAASMALQNTMGMICDPVGNRVEVPCLGKNVMAASNALSVANMALANFDAVIPLDEVILATDKVGKMMPAALRCTALGGLSITQTSMDIEKRLAQKN